MLSITNDISLVSRHIKTVMEGRPHKLLESVADRLVTEILNDYHMVQGLQLQIQKPHVAVPGVVQSLGERQMQKELQQSTCQQDCCRDGAIAAAGVMQHFKTSCTLLSANVRSF